MTYHACTLLTTLFSRDHSSVGELMTIYTTACKTNTNTLCVSVAHWTHTHSFHEWKKPTMTHWTADIWWRSCWVFTWTVTPLRFTVNVTLLVRGEKHISTDEVKEKDVKLNCLPVLDPPNSSRHRRDSQLASTWLGAHSGCQNEYSLQTYFLSDSLLLWCKLQYRA